MTVEEFVQPLDKVKRCGDGYKACCPAHPDKDPSLSATERDGKILLYCHAGCTTEGICDARGVELSDLFIEPRTHNGNSKTARTIEATYQYRDESGKQLFEAVRFFPKDFKQRQSADNGGWVWNLKGVRRVLYRLPELLAADPDATVFIAEGEKDVDRLRKLGLVATCNAMGAGSQKNNYNWRDEYSEFLRGRDVVIIPDNDQPGLDHANAVARSLSSIARSIKLLNLPGPLPKGGDVSDWLDAGNHVETLCNVVEDAPEYKKAADATSEQKKEKTALRPDTKLVKASTVQKRPIEWLWKPFLSIGTATNIAGDGGVGKSQLASKIVVAVTTGGLLPDPRIPLPQSSFDNANRVKMDAGDVLILTAEESLEEILVPRLEKWGANMARVHFLTGPELLLDKSGFAEIEYAIAQVKPRLVVVDSITAFLGGEVDSKSATSVRVPLRKLQYLAEKFRVAFLIITHFNKSFGANAGQRISGTTDFRNGVRSVLLVGEDPNNKERFLVFHDKVNAGRRGAPLAYRFKSDPMDDDIPYFEWDGSTDLKSSSVFCMTQALEKYQEKEDKQKKAEELVTKLLSPGWCKTSVITDALAARRYDKRIKDAVSEKLNVAFVRDPSTKETVWYWVYPEKKEEFLESFKTS